MQQAKYKLLYWQCHSPSTLIGTPLCSFVATLPNEIWSWSFLMCHTRPCCRTWQSNQAPSVVPCEICCHVVYLCRSYLTLCACTDGGGRTLPKFHHNIYTVCKQVAVLKGEADTEMHLGGAMHVKDRIEVGGGWWVVGMPWRGDMKTRIQYHGGVHECRCFKFCVLKVCRGLLAHTFAELWKCHIWISGAKYAPYFSKVSTIFYLLSKSVIQNC